MFSDFFENKNDMSHTSTIATFVEKTWVSIERLLNRKGFQTIVLDSDRALRRFIYKSIPDNCIVGLGNSLSTSALKIRDILLEKGNKVYYAWNGENCNRNVDTFEEHPCPDYFLTGANAITADGNLINNEYSSITARDKGLPKNIIAFSNPGSIARKILGRDITSNIIVFDNKPEDTNITIALTSYA